MNRIVDLTYPLDPEMVVWPGSPRPAYEWLERTNTGSANVTQMRICTHTGTHVDAPMHLFDEGQAIDQIPLSLLWGTAKMFVIDDVFQGLEVTKAHLTGSGFSMDEAGIFVMRTNMEQFSSSRDYNMKFAYPSIELLGWLIENGVVSYMTDAASVDPLDDEECPRHRLLLAKGIPIVENLKNLDKLPLNKKFTICAMPLALPGREGSPCRAAAWLDDETS